MTEPKRPKFRFTTDEMWTTRPDGTPRPLPERVLVEEHLQWLDQRNQGIEASQREFKGSPIAEFARTREIRRSGRRVSQNDLLAQVKNARQARLDRMGRGTPSPSVGAKVIPARTKALSGGDFEPPIIDE